MPPNTRRPTLTPRDWARAGLRALGTGGLAAVSVEPLAQELGATKGSFYWHFADRAALVDAVLELWEEVGTEQVISELEAEPDARQRLVRLFTLTFADPAPAGFDLAVLAAAHHPQVAPVLERVTRRRVDYMAGQIRAAGVQAEESSSRALQAYLLWIGLLQVTSAVPGVIPQGGDRAEFLRTVLENLEGLLTS